MPSRSSTQRRLMALLSAMPVRRFPANALLWKAAQAVKRARPAIRTESVQKRKSQAEELRRSGGGTSGQGKQHPIGGCAPISFEINPIILEELAPSWIIHQYAVVLVVNPGNNYVMQGSTFGFHGDNERATLFKMMPKVTPSSRESERFKPILTKIFLHLRSIDSMRAP